MHHLTEFGREKLSTLVIILSIIITLLTSIGVKFLDVKINNIELIDGQLYSVITNKGNINIIPEDILRIERSYTKEPITGENLELGKIYTNKGFIYLSSKDTYSSIGQELMKSVDSLSLPFWERSGVDWETVKKQRYSIGTPGKHIPLLMFLLELQNTALAIGGIALVILIFPLRLDEVKSQSTLATGQVQEVKEDELPDLESMVK